MKKLKTPRSDVIGKRFKRGESIYSIALERWDDEFSVAFHMHFLAIESALRRHMLRQERRK